MGFGSKAYGFCGRCGFRYKLSDLKPEVVNYRETDARVCPTCWDPDQPQLHVNELEVDDPQALRNPRPDLAQKDSRWGNSTVWNFTDSVESWRYVKPGGASNSITWDSEEEAIAIAQTVSGIGSLEYYEKADGTGSYADIDLATALANDRAIDTARVSIRLDDSLSNMGTWVGKFYWGTTTNTSVDPFSAGYNVSVVEPDWDRSMGDRYIVLEYDLSGQSNWTGTITSLRFDLYNTSSNFKSFSVSSIRIEEN